MSAPEIDRMTDALAHRGPDGRGIHRIEHTDGSGVALGHRRLSIIDIGGGAQPMCNEDGTVWVSFNGEIYNYRELRPALEAAGHKFASHSDTETIVHLYEQYGENFVDHMRGMFAIAIWDDRQRKLILVRDRMGQKPLVYSQQPGRLLFASEIKSILAVAPTRKLRPAAIDEYLLYGYIPHPKTAFENISKLPPAHMAVFENGSLRISQYWNPDLEPDQQLTLESARERLKETLDHAVKLRLRSDVPLGAFLSGGIDSTVIVGLMQRHNESRTKTFNIAFPGTDFDEAQYAEIAANHLKTEHRRLDVNSTSIDLIDKLVWLFDEPFADSSAVPTYVVSQLTSQYVKVALTGDGADELFCGYDRYATIDRLGGFDRMPQLLRRAITGPWVDLIPSGPKSSFRKRLKHRLQVLRRPLEKRYSSWISLFPSRASIYNRDFAAQIDMHESESFVHDIICKLGGSQPGTRAMRTDLLSYLPCDLLAKVDITSMANALECRSPFMDHHVVESALKIPFRLNYQAGKVKPMLTQTFSDLIPVSLQTRPKSGFGVPVDSWFKDQLLTYAKDALLSTNAFSSQFFSRDAMTALLSDQASGTERNGDQLWSLLFLELWGRQNFGA